MLRCRRGTQGSGRVASVAASLALLVAAVLLAGCGGGSSSSTGSSASSGGEEAAKTSSSSTSSSSAEPSKEFNDYEGVRGIEPVATFGKESDEAEREAASKVLYESFAAREEANFAGQCATLGERGMKAVFRGEESKASAAKCPAALEKIAKPLAQSEGVRANTLSGEIAALRVKGNQAFALYHGNDGNDWAVPMEEEGGEWKVGSLIALELPKTPPKAAKEAEQKKKKKKSEAKQQSKSKKGEGKGG